MNVTQEEISQFCEDINILIEEGFSKSEALQILRVIELRRQTTKLDLAKFLLARLIVDGNVSE